MITTMFLHIQTLTFNLRRPVQRLCTHCLVVFSVVLPTCWCVGEGGGVVAQLLPLLAPAVDPDAEAHEDDPAGPTDSCNKRWLLDHVGDLFCQTDIALFAAPARSATTTPTAPTTAAWHGGLFCWQLWEKETRKKKKQNEYQREGNRICKCWNWNVLLLVNWRLEINSNEPQYLMFNFCLTGNKIK